MGNIYNSLEATKYAVEIAKILVANEKNPLPPCKETADSLADFICQLSKRLKDMEI